MLRCSRDLFRGRRVDPSLNLPRRSGRIRNAVNGVRPRMRQMDVWSRDHRRPIEQEEKDRVAAGWYTSPDSEPRVRSAPAGDVPPTSRRVAHSRNVPASAPSEDDEKVGGRFSDGSIPGGYGKSPFSLDCTYHGCPLFVGASLAAAPQPLFCWLAGLMKNNKKRWFRQGAPCAPHTGRPSLPTRSKR